jgi:hypothetical protein
MAKHVGLCKRAGLSVWLWLEQPASWRQRPSTTRIDHVPVASTPAYQLLIKNPDGTLRDVGLREMAAECGCVLYWLTASRPDIASKLLGCPEWHWRRPFTIGWPYHIYAAEYHRVGGGGTWATIGRGLFRAGDTSGEGRHPDNHPAIGSAPKSTRCSWGISGGLLHPLLHQCSGLITLTLLD